MNKKTILAVLWEWGPETKYAGSRFWGCHESGDEKDCRYTEWKKLGLRVIGASKVDVIEGEGLDLLPPNPPEENHG